MHTRIIMFQLLQFFLLFQLFFFAYGSDSDSLVNCTAYPTATMCLNDISQDPIIPTEEDKENILRLHNQYREEVKPLAKQMYKMDWSDTMAELALKWAKQCRFDHDTFNARIIRGYSGVGQNVLGANFQPSWNLTVKNWHSEIADYHYGTETDAMVGHYTQEIYWDAKLIGCGGAYCPNSHLKYIYVCDYYTGQDSTLFPYTLANATHQLTTCPRPANSTLCDCNGKSCQYGGMLDINTCQCTCYQLATGDECAELTCKPDYTFCEHYKDTFCDVKYMYSFARYCPNMCNSCAK
ncbi:cysteine-rich venom protein Mr30-like [Octopus sinensis]|uniref:Cysteine-rich venom protein Mr30-like n=1 Tax=Octopus sinensis TaxID=2607531 RepID=A0A6P7SVH9_9MOLL|nr:cysteine-rich venom protein Mr30-like [Octopus sinensis]